MAAPTPPAALLLTGGASRRMGRDKASLIVAGQRLAVRTAALLTDVAAPIIEVGPGYTALAQVQESPAGGGPLAALAAGWAGLVERGLPESASVLVVATDMPRLTVGLLALLARHPRPGCVVPLDHEGRSQPLCARYPMATLARATNLVGAGQRSIHALLDLGGENVTWLTPSAWQQAAGRPDALVDVDTPADLAALNIRADA
ncbi:MAG TPA: NTP transferase domain-containing protein [Acidimicrobiales bacterium]|nr:NTP transferase domain-containing protein [Acidimicrobiales bacterium]